MLSEPRSSLCFCQSVKSTKKVVKGFGSQYLLLDSEVAPAQRQAALANLERGSTGGKRASTRKTAFLFSPDFLGLSHCSAETWALPVWQKPSQFGKSQAWGFVDVQRLLPSLFLLLSSFSHLLISVPLPGTDSVGLYHCPPRLCPITYIPLRLETHGPDVLYARWQFPATPCLTPPSVTEVKFTFWTEKIPLCLVNPALIFSALQAM